MKTITDPTLYRDTFTRWLSDGATWIGIFRNEDLGHPDCGRKVALSFDLASFDAAHVMGALPEGVTIATRMPDSTSVGVGWRYLLVAKCRTVEAALDAMKEETNG